MEETGECSYTMEELSQKTNIPYRTIWGVMARLKTKGLVSQKTVYELK